MEASLGYEKDELYKPTPKRRIGVQKTFAFKVHPKTNPNNAQETFDPTPGDHCGYRANHTCAMVTRITSEK